jgi:hypothetical protein
VLSEKVLSRAWIASGVAMIALCAASVSPARACTPPPRAHVLKSSRHAIVWRQSHRNRFGSRINDWFGCLRAHRAMRLASLAAIEDRSTGYPSPRSFQLAGDFVAFAVNTLTYCCGGDELLNVVDLRKRRRVVRRSIHLFVGQDESQYFSLLALRLSAAGHLAWVEKNGGGDTAATNAVRVYDSRGIRQLDTGPNGSITDLRIAGETVEWKHDGALRTATLQ